MYGEYVKKLYISQPSILMTGFSKEESGIHDHKTPRLLLPAAWILLLLCMLFMSVSTNC